MESSLDFLLVKCAAAILVKISEHILELRELLLLGSQAGNQGDHAILEGVHGTEFPHVLHNSLLGPSVQCLDAANSSGSLDPREIYELAC